MKGGGGGELRIAKSYGLQNVLKYELSGWARYCVDDNGVMQNKTPIAYHYFFSLALEREFKVTKNEGQIQLQCLTTSSATP